MLSIANVWVPPQASFKTQVSSVLSVVQPERKSESNNSWHGFQWKASLIYVSSSES